MNHSVWPERDPSVSLRLLHPTVYPHPSGLNELVLLLHKLLHKVLPVTTFCGRNSVISFLPRCMQCRRGLAMRILSHENSVRLSVCPSVRPSVTRVNCDKTVDRSVQIYIPYERTFSLVFWEEEWLVGWRPLLPEILGQPAPVGAKSPILNQ